MPARAISEEELLLTLGTWVPRDPMGIGKATVGSAAVGLSPTMENPTIQYVGPFMVRSMRGDHERPDTGCV